MRSLCTFISLELWVASVRGYEKQEASSRESSNFRTVFAPVNACRRRLCPPYNSSADKQLVGKQTWPVHAAEARSGGRVLRWGNGLAGRDRRRDVGSDKF